MGTDIHLIAETRPSTEDPWELVPGPIITCWRCEGRAIIDRTTYPNANPEWLAEHLECGTTLCIAGWAVLKAGAPPMPGLTICGQAERLLSLPNDEIFHPGWWTGRDLDPDDPFLVAGTLRDLARGHLRIDDLEY